MSRKLTLRESIYLFTILCACLFGIEFQASAANVCHAIDQCTCKTHDGKYVSLWQIDQRFNVKDDSGRPGFSYTYSPCTSINNAGTECQNVLGCQRTGTSKSDSFAIAYKPKLVETDYDSKNQLLFVYRGSTDESSGTQRKTTITLVCDTTATTPKLEKIFEIHRFNYGTTLTTKCACPGACKSSTTKSSGLSTGSILCIILLVLVVVYFVGAMVINKFALHKESWEIVPNRAFWKDFPSLVKDGVLFTYTKVTRSKGEYQQVS